MNECVFILKKFLIYNYFFSLIDKNIYKSIKKRLYIIICRTDWMLSLVVHIQSFFLNCAAALLYICVKNIVILMLLFVIMFALLTHSIKFSERFNSTKEKLFCRQIFFISSLVFCFSTYIHTAMLLREITDFEKKNVFLMEDFEAKYFFLLENFLSWY